MKRFFILPLMLSASCAFAQPTLTSSTNNPVAGDVFYGYMTDTDHVDPGPSGASATWDMSMIVVNDSDTTSYFTCAATPYCDSFPGANIVMVNAGDYVYGVSGTNGIKGIGAYSTGTYAHFEDSMTLTHFPLTFGTTYADTTTTEFSIFGTTVYITSYTMSHCDAWCTLTVPTGTFNNVLRVHTTSIVKDSMNIMGTPEVNLNATESYNWYRSGFHSPVLTVNLDTAGSGTPYVTDAVYYRAGSSGSTAVRGTDAVAAGIRLYPVPAAATLNIDVNGITTGEEVALSISDMSGREVYTRSFTAMSGNVTGLQVPVNDFANGIYMVRVVTAGRLLTGKFNIVK